MEARWLTPAVLTAARTSMGFQFQSLASAAPPLVGDLGLGYAEVGSLIGRHLGGGGSLGRRQRGGSAEAPVKARTRHADLNLVAD